MTVTAVAMHHVAATHSNREEAPPAAADEVTAPPRSTTFAASRLLLATRLVIELDLASDRFVQTVVAVENAAVLRRYPSEGQIAFSRGVAAYIDASRLSVVTRASPSPQITG